MDKETKSGPQEQPKDEQPQVRSDQTLMFNPQTRSYDVRLKTPGELQQERNAAEADQSANRPR